MPANFMLRASNCLSSSVLSSVEVSLKSDCNLEALILHGQIKKILILILFNLNIYVYICIFEKKSDREREKEREIALV